MKIWQATSAEHSHNLRIVGEFKTVEKAQAAEEALRGLIEAACEESEKSRPVYEIANKFKVQDLTASDFDGLKYCHDVRDANGKQIEIFTDEGEVQGLIKILWELGGKVQLYSQHEWQGS